MKTWSDIYKLPLIDSYIDDSFRSKRIIDAENNFVFQFEQLNDKNQIEILHMINGVSKPTTAHKIEYDNDGYILVDKKPIILIRGWGNLTGTGRHHLPPSEAINIQDTFAEFIIKQLTI